MNPGKDFSEFSLLFQDNWFDRGDVVETSSSVKLKVLETPHRKWYKRLLELITFGWYKAPYQYKIKIL